MTRDPRQTRVALVYKNVAASRGISHIGLGVAAMLTQRTLQALGYWAEVWPCNTAEDVRARLEAANTAAAARGHHPVSHVVISAPWIPTLELQGMLAKYPDVNFAEVSHSNFGRACPPAELTITGGYDAGAAHLRDWRDLCDGGMRCTLLAYAGGFTLVKACGERRDGACGFPEVVLGRAAWIRRVTR